MIRFASAFILFALLNACSTYEFPLVHRITIQQGNVVTQAMVDKLKPGMTKRQVQYVLGNPVINDQLNKDRWDYVYTIDVPDVQKLQKNLQVFFVEDRLSHFKGDYAPSEVLNPETETSGD